jgi:hypothetical protein
MTAPIIDSMLRDVLICGNEELLMRALERAGVKRSDSLAPAFGGVQIREDVYCPRNKAILIGSDGEVVAVLDVPEVA